MASAEIFADDSTKFECEGAAPPGARRPVEGEPMPRKKFAAFAPIISVFVFSAGVGFCVMGPFADMQTVGNREVAARANGNNLHHKAAFMPMQLPRQTAQQGPVLPVKVAKFGMSASSIKKPKNAHVLFTASRNADVVADLRQAIGQGTAGRENDDLVKVSLPTSSPAGDLADTQNHPPGRAKEDGAIGPQVIIDASNVACSTTGSFIFARLENCLKYFQQKGIPVLAVCKASRLWGPWGIRDMAKPDDVQALRELNKKKLLVTVPRGEDDDAYTLQVAYERNLYIVSNDRFSQWTKGNSENVGLNKKARKKWIRHRRISFNFIDGDFVPNPVEPPLHENDNIHAPSWNFNKKIGEEWMGLGAEVKKAAAARKRASIAAKERYKKNQFVPTAPKNA